MAKHIVISGYYGFGNTGDEAVLAGILASFGEVGLDTDVTVLSADPVRTMREHPGVSAVHRYRIHSVTAAIRSADLVISGGGSLLQDATSARSIRYYLFILQLANFLKRKTMIYAQGIGPLQNTSIRHATARVLNKTNAISVRDPQSKALLESIGVDQVPIELSADPSFLVEPDHEAADKILAQNGIGSTNLIGVSLRPWQDDAWLREARDGIHRISSELGANIVFIPMQEPRDVAVSDAVKTGTVLRDLGNVRTVKALIGRCNMVVGMRLHCLIFAASEGVPFVPIVYDPKVSSFAAMCGQSAGVEVGSIKAENLAGCVKCAWQERATLKERLADRIPDLKDLALASARLAARVVVGQSENLSGGV